MFLHGLNVTLKTQFYLSDAFARLQTAPELETGSRRGPFTSPVHCSFNRSIMPCGIPVQFRCNLQQGLWCTSVTGRLTGGAAYGGAPTSDVQ